MANGDLRAEQVDPRDVQVEVDDPVYRVYFTDEGGASDEYRLTGATDVREVLRWGTANAAGRSFQLFVETDGAGGRRLDLLATVS
ncbi:hypothetical protein [Curtobacterium citreum]|uniref:Uncharacterized protein n=1 Tax=Curtobacterium citreum TaxID=2036 RepID=A0ABT2HDI5_9MICO|nr:hypothetical protein [Curtobacterium citreum]MCS6521319.1 hypothetical protein [Curtobacterium citreum]